MKFFEDYSAVSCLAPWSSSVTIVVKYEDSSSGSDETPFKIGALPHHMYRLQDANKTDVQQIAMRR